MAQELINVGAAPNDGTGDPLRTAGIKINANFTELYNRPVTEAIWGSITGTLSNQTDLTLVLDSKLDALDLVPIDNSLATLDSRLDTVESTQATQDTAISNLESTQATQDTAISNLESTQATQGVTLTNLFTDVTELGTDLQTLNSTVTTQGTAIEDIQTTQVDLDVRIDSLESSRTIQIAFNNVLSDRIQGVEQGLQDLDSSLNGRITAAELSISDLNTSVTTIDTELATAEATLITHGNRLDTLELTQETHSTDLVALDNRLDLVEPVVISLDSRLDVTEVAISNLETTQATQDTAISDLETTLATQGTAISNLESTQATQGIAISDLETTQATQGTAISNLESTQTTQGTAISDLESRLDNAEFNIFNLQSSEIVLSNQISDLFVLTSGHTATLSSYGTRLTDLETTQVTQDTAISNLESTQATQGIAISDLETTQVTQAAELVVLDGRLDTAEVDINVLESGQINLENLLSRICPVGTLKMFAIPEAQVTAGWIPCDGRALSRTTYSELFSSMGTTWGAGDGSTTFNVPDLRDHVPAGLSTTNTLGSRVGSQNKAVPLLAHTHTVTLSAAGSHSHSLRFYQGGTGGANVSLAYGLGPSDTVGNLANLAAGSHTHPTTVSTEGTPSPTMDVRQQTAYVGMYIWTNVF